VTVPYVLGYSELAATQAITNAGLQAEVSRESSQGQCNVIVENPPGGDQVAAGSTVYILVAIPQGPCQDT
jgi:beta-lactam-binding protein with PASTA domain